MFVLVVLKYLTGHTLHKSKFTGYLLTVQVILFNLQIDLFVLLLQFKSSLLTLIGWLQLIALFVFLIVFVCSATAVIFFSFIIKANTAVIVQATLVNGVHHHAT